VAVVIWQKCLQVLEGELTAHQFNTWIKPLQAVVDDESSLRLFAPNKYIEDQVNRQFFGRIEELASQDTPVKVTLCIGTSSDRNSQAGHMAVRRAQNGGVFTIPDGSSSGSGNSNSFVARENFYPLLELKREFTFDNFVEG